MGTLRKIKKIVSSTTEFVENLDKTIHDEDSLEKGHDFERYVRSLFSQQYFTTVHWSYDRDRKHEGAPVEDDKAPDFKMRYNPTKEEFYVECKYRKHLLSGGKIKFASSYSINKYQEYGKSLPFYVVIGLGSDPDKIDHMFCIPLNEARWTELFPSVYMKHERPPGKMFFWKNGVLS